MELPLIAVAALIAAVVSRKFKFTPIPAYILTGMLLSRAGVQCGVEIEFLGKLGVVFLLFYVGLKINPETLRRSGYKTAVSGLIDFLFNFFPPFLLLYFLGFDLKISFVIASAVYVSSSAINLKMLVDDKKLIFAFAETVVFLMVFEDIVMVAFLSILSTSDLTAGLLVVFLAFLTLYFISSRIEKLVKREDEIPYLVTFSIPALSLLISETFKISEALVAILFGIALNRVKADRILTPFKEVFLAVFFVYFGTLVNLEFSAVALVLIFLSVAGKLAGSILIARFFHEVGDAKELFKYTLARGEFTVIFTALFAPQYAAMMAVVVLFTSITASLLTRIS